MSGRRPQNLFGYSVIVKDKTANGLEDEAIRIIRCQQAYASWDRFWPENLPEREASFSNWSEPVATNPTAMSPSSKLARNKLAIWVGRDSPAFNGGLSSAAARAASPIQAIVDVGLLSMRLSQRCDTQAEVEQSTTGRASALLDSQESGLRLDSTAAKHRGRVQYGRSHAVTYISICML